MQDAPATGCPKDPFDDPFDSTMLQGTEGPRMKTTTGVPVTKAVMWASQES